MLARCCDLADVTREVLMGSNNTGKQPRVSSGQFSTLKTQSTPDGSIEYVFDETTHTLEESSNVESYEQLPTPAKEQGGEGSRNMLAIGGVLLAFVLVSGGIVYAMQGSKERVEGADDAVEETASFRPYSGSAAKAAPEPKKEMRRAAAASDDDLPEELQGLELGSDDEVIVLEEIHPEDVEEESEAPAPEPAALVKSEEEYVPRSPENYPLDLDKIRRERGVNPKQRQLLRKMNQDLDAGKIKPFNPGPLPRGLRPARITPPVHYSPSPADIRARAIEHKAEVAAQEEANQDAEDNQLDELANPGEPSGPTSTQ